MTAPELLVTCQQAGIMLAVDGALLDIDAPRGALTPDLRAELTRHKLALMALLAPSECVVLRGGFVVPVSALALITDLEARGFDVRRAEDGHGLIVSPRADLTPDDVTAIREHRAELLRLIDLDTTASAVDLPDDDAARLSSVTRDLKDVFGSDTVVTVIT
jgi:hypothetical protein